MDSKRIVVTGESGFIGSNLAPFLMKQGHEIYSIYRYISNRRPNTESNIIYGDIRDHVFLNKTLPEINPEVIIHLAALTPVAMSFDQPIEYSETNYMGSLNIIHAAMKCSNLKMFLWNSTSEAYGIQEEVPINESAELKPNTPYAVAKAAVEMYLKNYLGPAYEFPYFIMCPFNTFGRRTTNHYVVESLITQMLTKNDITLGDVTPTRDFLYIDDLIDAYDKVINGVENIVGEKYIHTNTKMNVCTGRGVTIEELCGIVAAKLDWKGTIRKNTTYHRPTEIPTLIGDHTYATLTWGWQWKVQLEEGIQKGIDYWRSRVEEKS